MKIIKTIAISLLLFCGTLILAQLLENNLSYLRTEFLQHGKGYTQHFINSFIN